ncbi:type-2 ice-structuring protein-like isoform X2 [Poecilia formosa]|uniref:type-2 ice-structuring protein-like isoform X2 n=1 Tax=Poecilia formosa TaxID=48698 RepID=UPI0007B91ACC|nr:PREDICTED: type-2 ice-structuring protein-like isoform X2 [Poecilia formosa]
MAEELTSQADGSYRGMCNIDLELANLHCVVICTMKLLAVFFLFIMEKCSLAHEKVHLFRRSVECPTDWTAINDRCFRYVADIKTWAAAEKHCLTLEANLASVHSQEDNDQLQTLIFTATRKSKEAWIGGSDGQETNIWLWSDGSPMTYTNWCPGQPNNALTLQHCIQMNYSKKKCWDDVKCSALLPSICVRKNLPPAEA